MASFGAGDSGKSSQPGPSRSSKLSGKAFSSIDLDGHDLPPSPAPSSPRNGKRYALATELVYTEGTDQYNASSQPIYQVCQPLKYRAILSAHKRVPLSIFGPLEQANNVSISSPPHSNRNLEEEEASMTTQDQAILHELTSNGTWLKSCALSEPLLFHRAWEHWM